MKFLSLLFFIAITFTSCSKSKDCYKCTIYLYQHDTLITHAPTYDTIRCDLTKQQAKDFEQSLYKTDVLGEDTINSIPKCTTE